MNPSDTGGPSSSIIDFTLADPSDSSQSPPVDVEEDRLPDLIAMDCLQLNISGQSFKLTKSTVAALPSGCLLRRLAFDGSSTAASSSNDVSYLPNTQEYFFARSPDLFQYVVEYCQTGHVHCHGDSTMATAVREEFRFWAIGGGGETLSKMCCRPDEPVETGRLGPNGDGKSGGGMRGLRRFVSLRRQRRDGDGGADGRCTLSVPCCVKAFTSLSVFFLALSILNLIISTEPGFHGTTCWFSSVPSPTDDTSPTDLLAPSILERLRQLLVNSSDDDGVWFFNTTNVWFESFSSLRRWLPLGGNADQVSSTTTTATTTPRTPPDSSSAAGRRPAAAAADPKLDEDTEKGTTSNNNCSSRHRKNLEASCINANFIFDVIETVCMVWFTVEYLIRFAVANCRLEFLKDFLNIIDMLATIPFYVEIALDSLTFICYQYEKVDSFLAALKVLRVFRIFKLARYFRSLRVFGMTLAESKRELATITMFTSVTVIIFSSMIYYAEKDEPDSLYVSIPASFYWCIVTITTCGYGDMYPRTVGGKIIGAVACVSGILILAFPVSILTEHFMSTYKRESKPTASTSNIGVEEERRRSVWTTGESRSHRGGGGRTLNTAARSIGGRRRRRATLELGIFNHATAVQTLSRNLSDRLSLAERIEESPGGPDESVEGGEETVESR